MGGFAVIVDWDRPVELRELEPMMALVPHRMTGALHLHATSHAVLAEGRTTSQTQGDPEQLATLGPLKIVGDLRLYDTSRLRALAGGDTATTGLDDRHLILAAFRRRGMHALDALDGDFAFVIWDDERRRVLAVRDRFAVKPIFFEVTPTGIRLASEVKQLVATSPRPVEPDTASLAEYITYEFAPTRRTFLTGIERIVASHALEGTASGIRHHRYWDPEPTRERHDPESLPGLFRDHLTEAVRRRLDTSLATVSQLSGGLDSPAIAAAAATLARSGETVDLTTVSAVYDDPSIDESHWIDDIVATQPFPHRRFIPEVGDIALFDDDMWTTDGPLTSPIRDIEHMTARIAAEIGADLVFTGNGGDHLGYQGHHLADMLRAGRPVRFGRDAVRSARWSGATIGGTILAPLRQVAPGPLRSLARRLRREEPPSVADLLVRRSDTHHGHPTAGIDPADIRSPLFTRINEMHSAIFAAYGLDLSHPYMDRALVEFVASIHPLDLPFDGSTKTLVRQAFTADLPSSVIDRRTATVANDYLLGALAPHRATYRDRFADLPDGASAFIDPVAYRDTLGRFDDGSLELADLMALWRAWQASAFLEGAIRYTAQS
jgi:asparagine synthase (glutamine-hydrolysing)